MPSMKDKLRKLIGSYISIYSRNTFFVGLLKEVGEDFVAITFYYDQSRNFGSCESYIPISSIDHFGVSEFHTIEQARHQLGNCYNLNCEEECNSLEQTKLK